MKRTVLLIDKTLEEKKRIIRKKRETKEIRESYKINFFELNFLYEKRQKLNLMSKNEKFKPDINN
jgi:hypothetical protein